MTAPWDALPAAVRAALRPGAEAAVVDAAERALGLALPGDARALYAAHDGQRPDAPGVLVGLRWLPLADAVAEHAKWRDVLATAPDLADLPVEAEPVGAVRAVYADPRWVPVADDGAGNGLALDLAPGATGTLGQVIVLGPDEPVRRVVAPSLSALFARLAAAVADGRVVADAAGVRFRDGGGFFDAAPDALG